MTKTLFAATAMALFTLSGPTPAGAQTAGDEDMAWISDQDDDFFYLAYSIPESDRFAIAFVCSPHDRKVFFALHEKQGGTIKVGDKFEVALAAGDAKVTLQAETAFDANEEMLRSVAPMKADDPFIRTLTAATALDVTRAGKTVSYPLAEIEPRLREFQNGCGLKK